MRNSFSIDYFTRFSTIYYAGHVLIYHDDPVKYVRPDPGIFVAGVDSRKEIAFKPKAITISGSRHPSAPLAKTLNGM